MKRIIAILLTLLLVLPTLALADVDLSAMSYDELVALKDQLNKAIWESKEWQEVTVPQGLYEVGADIPEGHWTIAAADGQSISVSWGTQLNETKTNVDVTWDEGFYEYESLVSKTYSNYQASERTEVDFDLKAGQYVVVDYGQAVFTPYKGKPELGFK